MQKEEIFNDMKLKLKAKKVQKVIQRSKVRTVKFITFIELLSNFNIEEWDVKLLQKSLC